MIKNDKCPLEVCSRELCWIWDFVEKDCGYNVDQWYENHKKKSVISDTSRSLESTRGI